MKKFIFVATLFSFGLISQSVNAQVRISLSANIGAQPVWGPVGYNHVEYYYMPDIDAFYYVPGRQYVYMERGNWIFANNLPSRYNYYDINTGYKVVVNEPRPYRNVNQYRAQYGKYKGDHSQQIIRNSHETKYYEIKEHPEHNKWRAPNHGRDDDHGRNDDHNRNDNRGRGRRR
jgi:hypothetical protein